MLVRKWHKSYLSNLSNMVYFSSELKNTQENLKLYVHCIQSPWAGRKMKKNCGQILPTFYQKQNFLWMRLQKLIIINHFLQFRFTHNHCFWLLFYYALQKYLPTFASTHYDVKTRHFMASEIIIIAYLYNNNEKTTMKTRISSK